MLRFVQLLTEKEHREGVRYKQVDIARETGLAASYISGLITGRIDPGTMKLSTAQILCNWLNCTPNDFIVFDSDEKRSA